MLEDEILTIRPPQPASSMSGNTAWVTWKKTPCRFTSITFFHSSKVILVKRRKDVIPAAFTRMVIGPSARARCREPHLPGPGL